MSAVPVLVPKASVAPRTTATRPGSGSAQHTRTNTSVLSGLEKKVLLWLAARMPRWVTPDHLTVLGFLACGAILAGYALTNLSPAFLWVASLGFALNWFGDSLDGTLARYRKIERPRYGYFVDHGVDSVNMLMVGLGLGATPWVRMDFALLAIVGYLMMSVLTYITTHVRGVFQLSYGSLGPTEVRLLLVGLNTLAFFFGSPRVPLLGVGAFDAIILSAGIVLIGLFIVMGLRGARELAELEPPRA